MRICNITRIALAAASAALAGGPPEAPPNLISPYQHYSLKLNSLFSPDTRTAGLFMKARIDGGPVLRMLLDSGAQYVVLGKRAAAPLGKTAGAGLELVGIGAAPGVARRLRPETVQIGDLELRDCGVLALDDKLPDGLDGVIPLSLFSGFLVRLDMPGRILDLEPYPENGPVADGGYSAVRSDHGLIFLPAVLPNSQQSGYILLDTGATYNALSPAAAGRWAKYPALATSVSLRGGTGDADGLLLPAGLRFRFGSRVLSADPAVVVDLSEMTSHHQFEISGVLGYPGVSHSIIRVNYRDALVRFEDR